MFASGPKKKSFGCYFSTTIDYLVIVYTIKECLSDSLNNVCI